MKPRELLVFYVAVIFLVILCAARTTNQQKEIKQMIQACYAAGGTPIYDLCASEIKIIKLPGYDYAPEVSDYPSNKN